MSQLITIMAALTAALAVGVLSVGTMLLAGDRRRALVTTRLQRSVLGSNARQAEAARREKGPRLDIKAVRGLVIEGVNRAVARQSFAANLQRRLSRADLKITVGEFLIVNASATIGAAGLAYLIFGTPVHIVVGIVLGLLGPHIYVRFKQRARLKRFDNQLGDTLAMLANSLRSGYSMLQSMDLVGREMQPPISIEFQRVTREVGLGLTAEEALTNMTRRINSVDLELMVTAINVQREVGGNLSEILDIIASTIRERVKLKGEIKTLTAQQTMAGYIITGLPIVLFLFLLSIDNEYMSRFWTWVPCGWIMSGVSIVMMGVGYFVMRKITAIEV